MMLFPLSSFMPQLPLDETLVRPKSSLSSRPPSFVPTVHSWAQKLTFRTSLGDVTLANIMSGSTCTPINLADFEAYLLHKEYCLENLHFVVWYQDYRKRYLETTKALESYTEPNTTTASVYSYLDNDSTWDAEISPPQSAMTTPTSGTFPGAMSSVTHLLSAAAPFGRQNKILSSGTKERLEQQQGDFKDECHRIIATFLRPGAAEELNMDSRMRDTLMKKIMTGSHPDIFLPVYQEVHHLLQSTSVPRFLSFAATNINRPKQLFWYFVGVTDIFLSILIAVIMIAYIPTPPEQNRAWRLFPVLFAGFGAMQVYSAFRGFCNQVWQRNSAQVRAWEMHDMDLESRKFVEQIQAPPSIKPPPSPTSSFNIFDQSAVQSSLMTPASPGSPGFSMFEKKQLEGAVPAFLSESRVEMKRPPIFGPERVIQDPHVKAAQAMIMTETWIAGGIFATIFSIVVFSWP
ncbi:hypothetical protein C8J56DRAFT_1173187 [Mycena floridula]|nr:hypothetical protein C8J56DRAFT_1173187 [Mycena floridula]